MKRIYCELHLFDLNQHIYIVDTDTGEKNCVAVTSAEQLPEVISAISNEKKVNKVYLAGNSIFAAMLAEDIVEYSKRNYNWNNIEVEVIK